jgi:hypothetical protein
LAHLEETFGRLLIFFQLNLQFNDEPVPAGLILCSSIANDRERTSLVPYFLGLARDRRRSRVLDLQPTDGATGPIRRAEAL